MMTFNWFKKSNTNNVLIKDHKKLDEGYLAVCEGVSQTLGGEGKTALLDSGHDKDLPTLTKDGVSVAQRIRFKDAVVNFGALQAIQCAARTLQKVGDNTTTSLVFAKSYLKNYNRKNFNKAVERGIYKAVEEVNQHIKKLAKPANEKHLLRIATTSCNNDEELGKIIIQAFKEVGFQGSVEVSKNPKSDEVKVIEQQGMVIKNQGYSSAFFINSETKAVFEGDDVVVACFQVWNENQDILDFVKDHITKNGKKAPLLVVTERPISELKEKFIVFKQAGINICLLGLAVNSELENVTLLNDIALFTSGESYHPDTVERRNDGTAIIKSGIANKVVISDLETTLAVKETPKQVENLVASLKLQEKKDEARIKRLEGVSSIIEVGGLSANDIREKFDRVEDALSSVKSATAEGYIAGGGSTLLYISKKMNLKLENKEEQKGYNLVKEVLKEPFKQILKNANRESKIKGFENQCNDYGIGYNAKTDCVSDLLEDGIIDSAKSIKAALESSTESAVKMFNIGVIVHYVQ